MVNGDCVGDGLAVDALDAVIHMIVIAIKMAMLIQKKMRILVDIVPSFVSREIKRSSSLLQLLEISFCLLPPQCIYVMLA